MKKLEQIFGIEKANEIIEKAKITRAERGYSGKASTEEKELERRRKISNSAKKNPKCGGKRLGSGRGKKGWYKRYFCDSSYELAWVIYHIDHNILFERNTEGFDYFFDGEWHKFYPDFIKQSIYYEIKGYKTKQLEAKIEQFPYKIIVLYEKDIKYILDYVIKKYGKNFISLYEDKKYIKSCKKCGGYICSQNKSGICKKCFTNNLKGEISVTKKKIEYRCVKCDKIIKKNKSNLCKKCYKQKEKFEVDKNTLKNLIEKYSYETIGKKFGISGNTVKKRVIKLGIEIKHEIGYWNKINGKLIQEEKEKNIKYCKDCNKKLCYKNKSGYCKKCIAKYNFKQVK